MSSRDRLPISSTDEILCYEDLIRGETVDGFDWPVFDEHTASTICYTSGTTGNPKGVVYSHRAACLQTMLAAFDLLRGGKPNTGHTILPLSPLFHGNAWNTPFIAPYSGARLVLPGRDYRPESLFELLKNERVTISFGVPTHWSVLFDWMETNRKRLPDLRTVICGGAAPSRALVRKIEQDHGIEFLQIWGATEAQYHLAPRPSREHAALPVDEQIDNRMRSARTACGLRYRIVDADGRELPWNGDSAGNLGVKGPWVASGYLGGERALDDQGYFATGDIATIEPDGYITIVDRSKDVIKSGGEWISSVEIEQAAATHPDVLQAAAIAVPHEKWGERPLLVASLRPGSTLSAAKLQEHIRPLLDRWRMPESVELLNDLPIGGTGKIDKKALRHRFVTDKSIHL